MSGSSLAAPSSINGARTNAHLLLGQRLGKLDLSPLLLYTITSAPDTALPFLAWQFDMLAPWWQLLEGASSQRRVIQQAIALHRFMGTPFALQSIIANLGFALATIEEGETSWGGDAWPADEGWAVFRVLISKALVVLAPNAPASWDAVTDVDLLVDVATLQQAESIEGVAVSGALQSELVEAIAFFKPARCWLDSVWFQEIPQDEPPIAVRDSFTLSAGSNILEPALVVRDQVTAPSSPLLDEKQIVPSYNAHFYFAGITYGANEPAVADSGVVIDT